MTTTKKAVVYIGSQELAKVSSIILFIYLQALKLLSLLIVLFSPSLKQKSIIDRTLISSLGLKSPDFSNARRLRAITPRRAAYKDLALYHSRDYLDVVLDPASAPTEEEEHERTVQVVIDADYGLEDDCPPFPGLPEYMQLVGGATLTAASALRQGVADVAICWDGGRHHARKAQASGFCYVADCILAILALKRINLPAQISIPIPQSQSQTQPKGATSHAVPRRKPQLMYLDLDLHFADAVADAFHSPGGKLSAGVMPQVLTLSIHHASPGFFPTSPLASLPDISSDDFDPFTLSIPLKQGASDATYASIWPIVERLRSIFKPECTVVQCGVDGLVGDPCKTFNWSLGGENAGSVSGGAAEGSLGWCVGKVLRWPGKKLLLGGGGYNSPNAARAWAYLTSVALENPLDLDTQIPDHAGFPLYAPSFTLDVPAGNMSDKNSTEYLKEVEVCYENVFIALRNKLDAT